MTRNFVVVVNIFMPIFCHIGSSLPYLHIFVEEFVRVIRSMTETFLWSELKISNDRCTKEGKDQESVQSNTTPDPGYQLESNKLTIGHHKRELRGQLFPSK